MTVPRTALREVAKNFSAEVLRGLRVFFASSRGAVCSLALIAAAIATPLAADAPKVGDDAPNFKAHGTIINPPEFARELKDCKGDVILIYEWHARDATKGGLADIQALHTKWGGRGLHVWTIHRLDFEKFPQIDVMARKEGWTFPICMGGFYDDRNDFFGYKDGKSFRAAVVSVDAKVAWYGQGDGWKAALDAELKKVVYPNLGKHTVAEGAHMTAKKFGERDFGRALAECERLLATDLAAEVKADLELVAKLAGELASRRLEVIKKAKDEKRYDIAMKTLTLLEEEFKGHKISSGAADERKALKKDKAIKKEIEAYENLDKLIAKDGKGDPQTYINALRTFAKGQSEFAAAGVATKMADELKAGLE